MSEAIENVTVSSNEEVSSGTPLGRRARAHRPREEIVGNDPISGAPVPPTVPGEFVVVLGAAVPTETLRGLGEGMAAMGGAEATTAGLLSWLEFVEVEVRGLEGCKDLVEGLRLLRGAVMVAGAAGQRGVVDNLLSITHLL